MTIRDELGTPLRARIEIEVYRDRSIWLTITTDSGKQTASSETISGALDYIKSNWPEEMGPFPLKASKGRPVW